MKIRDMQCRSQNPRSKICGRKLCMSSCAEPAAARAIFADRGVCKTCRTSKEPLAKLAGMRVQPKNDRWRGRQQARRVRPPGRQNTAERAEPSRRSSGQRGEATAWSAGRWHQRPVGRIRQAQSASPRHAKHSRARRRRAWAPREAGHSTLPR